MLNQWELVARLLLAAGLGSAVGWERERLQWAAGLRTHMLVAVGSCLMIIVSAYGFSPVLSAARGARPIAGRRPGGDGRRLPRAPDRSSCATRRSRA